MFEKKNQKKHEADECLQCADFQITIASDVAIQWELKEENYVYI